MNRTPRRKRGYVGKSGLEIKIKICAVIIILIVLINSVSPSFLENLRTKSGADKDHNVDQLVSMAVSAYHDAKTAISEAAEAMSRQEIQETEKTVEDELDLESENDQ